MKFGLRTPSLKKRIAARTSWKRVLRHNLGFKAPRGWGWLTNPKKAAYNRVYSRTTVDIFGGFSRVRRARSSGSGLAGGLVLAAVVWVIMDSLLFKALLSVGAIVAILWVAIRVMTPSERPEQLPEAGLELDYERATLGDPARSEGGSSKSTDDLVC